MNIQKLFHTVYHLRFTQILYQIKNRLYKSKWENILCLKLTKQMDIITFPSPIKCLEEDDTFMFLNISSSFQSWNDTTNGMLWVYNLNYMDWLLQDDVKTDEGIKWIDKFIADLPQNRIGLDPYPTALRVINWIKFITLHYDEIDADTKRVWNNSLYSQYMLLSKNLEYHLLGNHLLEDAYSLFIASIYFQDSYFHKKASKLLKQELNEQILPDGAHYEQSPMYHCILLDRLLDCYNFSCNNISFGRQNQMNSILEAAAIKMLGHLENIINSDKTIPLLNDSAYGIAPKPIDLFDYGRRLGLNWKPITMKECGYRRLRNGIFDSIIDIGNITAPYQPGHSHADTFNYELRINGKSFIIDTGISTYNKTLRRQLERSTIAHNTVTVNGRNSSEVWGGFRVGNRAKVEILGDSNSMVKAQHNGFGKTFLHTRKFEVKDNEFRIEDVISNSCDAVNFIHFSPDVKVVSYNDKEIITDHYIIKIEGATLVEITDGAVSTQYNVLLPSKVSKIHFSQKSTYTISFK